MIFLPEPDPEVVSSIMSRMVVVLIMGCLASQTESSGGYGVRDWTLFFGPCDRFAHQKLIAAHTPRTISPITHGNTFHAVAVVPVSLFRIYALVFFLKMLSGKAIKQETYAFLIK